MVSNAMVQDDVYVLTDTNDVAVYATAEIVAAEDRLDYLLSAAFAPNHQVMRDWAIIRQTIKSAAL